MSSRSSLCAQPVCRSGGGGGEKKKHKKPQPAAGKKGPQGTAAVSAAFVDPVYAELMQTAAQHRQALGISCYRLAALAHLSLSTVCLMEAGVMVSAVNARERYCRVCGLPMTLVPLHR